MKFAPGGCLSGFPTGCILTLFLSLSFSGAAKGLIFHDPLHAILPLLEERAGVRSSVPLTFLQTLRTKLRTVSRCARFWKIIILEIEDLLDAAHTLRVALKLKKR